MLTNNVFESYIEAQGQSQKEFWEGFDSDDAWAFFADVEREYNCGGLCYVPLFYLTRNINEGRPEKECIREIINDVFNESVPIF